METAGVASTVAKSSRVQPRGRATEEPPIARDTPAELQKENGNRAAAKVGGALLHTSQPLATRVYTTP